MKGDVEKSQLVLMLFMLFCLIYQLFGRPWKPWYSRLMTEIFYWELCIILNSSLTLASWADEIWSGHIVTPAYASWGFVVETRAHLGFKVPLQCWASQHRSRIICIFEDWSEEVTCGSRVVVKFNFAILKIPLYIYRFFPLEYTNSG